MRVLKCRRKVSQYEKSNELLEFSHAISQCACGLKKKLESDGSGRAAAEICAANKHMYEYFSALGAVQITSANHSMTARE
jgi:hypothetical protein